MPSSASALIKRHPIITIAAALVVVLAVALPLSLSSSPKSGSPSVTTPSVRLTSSTCSTSDVTFSGPGVPAVVHTGTFVGITITNRHSTPCTLAQVATTTKPITWGYGVVFARAVVKGVAVGPVSLLRGVAGSTRLALPAHSSVPRAEFTLGFGPTTKVSGCKADHITAVALSLDGVHYQTVPLTTNHYFASGIAVCVSPSSSLNTSPVSIIPLFTHHKTTHPKH